MLSALRLPPQAPPVDTGDYAPIALPVSLAGIAALVFCMKKREEDAE